MNEELLYKISFLEQEAKKLEENIKAINEQILEFEGLKLSISNLDKEVLAGLGKGVYFKSQVQDQDFLVNVGCNVLVKKNKEQAVQIVDKQIKELSSLKLKLLENIEQLNKQMFNLVEKASSGNLA